MKIVFGVAVGVFWVIAQIASALGKKKEQAKRERVRLELERNAHQRRGPDWEQVAQTPPLPPPPVNRPPAPQPYQSAPQYPPVPPRPPQQQQHRQPQRPARQPKPPKLPKKKKQPPAPPVPVLEEVEETRRTVVESTEQRKQREPRVGARELRTWLNPSTMRQQFIVTEILQPPLTLRPPRE